MNRLTRRDFKKISPWELCGVNLDCPWECEDCFVMKLYSRLVIYENFSEDSGIKIIE